MTSQIKQVVDELLSQFGGREAFLDFAEQRTKEYMQTLKETAVGQRRKCAKMLDDIAAVRALETTEEGATNGT